LNAIDKGEKLIVERRVESFMVLGKEHKQKNRELALIKLMTIDEIQGKY